MGQTDSSLAVIDAHCHVASTQFIPEAFLADVAANLRVKLCAYGQQVTAKRLLDLLIAQHQDHFADELVREMDAAGITATVLLAPDFSQAMSCEYNLWEIARRHHAIRQRHPGRFHVFIGADPRHGGEGVDQFERCITEFGFEGLKLYPPCGYSPSDTRLFPYFEICAARGLPVLTHTGPSAQRLDYRFAQPRLIDGSARAFPAVNFILAHGGVNHVREVASLCAYRPNVYLDVAGFTGAVHPSGWPAHLNAVFKMGINHKVIFGTDYPIFRMAGGLSVLLSTLRKGGVALRDVRNVDQRRILYENISRLLPVGSRAPIGATKNVLACAE